MLLAQRRSKKRRFKSTDEANEEFVENIDVNLNLELGLIEEKRKWRSGRRNDFVFELPMWLRNSNKAQRVNLNSELNLELKKPKWRARRRVPYAPPEADLPMGSAQMLEACRDRRRKRKLRRGHRSSDRLLRVNVKPAVVIRGVMVFQRETPIATILSSKVMSRVEQKRSDKMGELRQQLKQASDQADETCTLAYRTTLALKTLLRERQINPLINALSNLGVTTRFSQRCCVRLVEQKGVSIILELMRNCNRSKPHQELLRHAIRSVHYDSKCVSHHYCLSVLVSLLLPPTLD